MFYHCRPDPAVQQEPADLIAEEILDCVAESGLNIKNFSDTTGFMHIVFRSYLKNSGIHYSHRNIPLFFPKFRA